MPSRAASALALTVIEGGREVRRDRRSPVIRYIPHEHQAPPARVARTVQLAVPPSVRQVTRRDRGARLVGDERTGRGMYYWVTANYRVQGPRLRGLAEHCRASRARKHESDLFIELRTAHASNQIRRCARSLVSETLDGLVCDEAAQWKPGPSGRNTSGHARGTAGARVFIRHAARA